MTFVTPIDQDRPNARLEKIDARGAAVRAHANRQRGGKEKVSRGSIHSIETISEWAIFEKPERRPITLSTVREFGARLIGVSRTPLPQVFDFCQPPVCV
jgi:hypothetical protein